MRTSYRGHVCSVCLNIAASSLGSARSRSVLLPVGGLRFSRIVAGSFVARRSAATAAFGRGRNGFPLASRCFDCGKSCASGAPTHRPSDGWLIFIFFLIYKRRSVRFAISRGLRSVLMFNAFGVACGAFCRLRGACLRRFTVDNQVSRLSKEKREGSSPLSYSFGL